MNWMHSLYFLLQIQRFYDFFLSSYYSANIGNVTEVYVCPFVLRANRL